MSIADSTDLPPQRNTLYTTAELFGALRCESCQFWHGAPGSYRAPCELNLTYAAPAFNDGCQWHSQNSSAAAAGGIGMNNSVKWTATIPLTEGAMKAHGDGGFRLTFDMSEQDTPAYIRLLLARGHVLTMTTEWSEEETPHAVKPARKRKAKPHEPEWGDDDGSETGDYTG